MTRRKYETTEIAAFLIPYARVELFFSRRRKEEKKKDDFFSAVETLMKKIIYRGDTCRINRSQKKFIVVGKYFLFLLHFSY